METNKQTRRKNLIKLIELSDNNESELARKTGLASSQVNQLRHGETQMGDAVARRIENNLGLEVGWLDQPEPISAKQSLVQRMFDSLDEEEQDYVLGLLERMYQFKNKRSQ